MATNVGGPIHKLVTDAMKLVCPFCNGTHFQVSFELVNNNELFAGVPVTKAGADPEYLINAGCNTIVFLCMCGMYFGKIAWLQETVSAQAVPAITLTDYNCTTVNDLAGLYIYVLGGTSKGNAYKIVSNTVANPTVLTLDSSPDADILNKDILITRFKEGV